MTFYLPSPVGGRLLFLLGCSAVWTVVLENSKAGNALNRLAADFSNTYRVGMVLLLLALGSVPDACVGASVAPAVSLLLQP